MPTIDPVVLRLEADLRNYRANISEAQRLSDQRLGAIEARGRKMGEGVKAGFNLAKGAALGYVSALSVGAITSAINAALDHAKALERSAGLAAAGVEEFQRAAHAARSVGIESDKLADIYKDVNDKIGDFIATGGGELKDFFDNIAPKVGVTADQFKRLSGPEALQLYVSSLEKAGVSQKEMTFYLEAIANDASALLPILRNNGEEFDRLARSADELGIVMDEAMIRKSVEAGKKLDDLGAVLQGKIRVAVAENTGLIDLLANAFVGLINAAGRAGTELRRFVALKGEVIETAKSFNPFATADERAAAARKAEVFGSIKNSPDATLRSPVRVNPGAVLPGAGTIGGPGVSRPKPSGLQVGNILLPEIIRPTARFASEGSNPFGDPGRNGDALLPLLATAAPQATALIQGLTADLEALADQYEQQRRAKENQTELEIDALEAEAGATRNRQEREEIEARILDLRQQAERDELEAAIAASEYADAAKARADLARKQSADRVSAGQTQPGPLERYADRLSDPRADVEAAVVRKLEDVNRGISDAIGKAIGTKDPFIKELLSILLDQILFRPLAEALSVAGGGGLGGGYGGGLGAQLGGLLGSVLGGAIFGRASGGPVTAGQTYLVGEKGPELLSMGGASGHIIPNTQLRAARSSPTVVQPVIQVDARGAVMNKEFAEMILAQSKRYAADAAGQAYRQSMKDVPGRLAAYKRDGH